VGVASKFVRGCREREKSWLIYRAKQRWIEVNCFRESFVIKENIARSRIENLVNDWKDGETSRTICSSVVHLPITSTVPLRARFQVTNMP